MVIIGFKTGNKIVVDPAYFNYEDAHFVSTIYKLARAKDGEKIFTAGRLLIRVSEIEFIKGN